MDTRRFRPNTSLAHETALCAILCSMTNLMRQAIDVLRELSEDRQDKVARAILTYAAHDDDEYELSDEERDEVRVGFEEARRGEFVAEADVQRYRDRHDA